VWCKLSLWAPSCYHGSVGHGWEVVENLLPDNIQNRNAERTYTGLGLNKLSDNYSNNIASMDTQGNVEDALGLQSGGGVVGAYIQNCRHDPK